MYLAHVVTFTIAGVHHANVYVYSAVAAFVGFSGFFISVTGVP
jgi:hypothetical protein